MTRTGFLHSGHLVFLFLCVNSLSLLSCGRAIEPIKLGLAINLSGRGGISGEHIRDGALLAVRMINESGGINGRQLVLLVRDDENDPAKVLQVDEELINEGVAAIIGHSYSSNTTVAYPLISSKGGFLITAFTATNELSQHDDFFFRTSVDCRLFGRKAAELFTNRKVKSLAVIMDMVNPGYAISYIESIKKYFAGSVTEIRFTSKADPEWPSIIGEVMAVQPNMVMVLAEAGLTGIAAQKLRNAGYTGDFTASIWAQGPSLFNFGNRAIEGMSLITFIPEENHRQAYLLFAERLQKEFNEKPNSLSARSYELLTILADVLRRCKEISPQELKKQLLAKQYETILGEVQFDQYGDVDRPVYEVVIADGQFRMKGVI